MGAGAHVVSQMPEMRRLLVRWYLEERGEVPRPTPNLWPVIALSWIGALVTLAIVDGAGGFVATSA